MLLEHELDSLTEEEMALLHFVYTNGGIHEDRVVFIKSFRKEYLIDFYQRYDKKLTDKGKEVIQSLIKKLMVNPE